MKGILILFLTVVSIGSQAQFVSLKPAEIARLKTLVRIDASAAKLYEDIKAQADRALKETPNPIDTVVSEGHLATDPKKIATIQSLRDIDRLYALAIAYKLEGSSFYRDKAFAYLTAWAKTNRPQGNPINDTKFESYFFAFDLLQKEMSGADRNLVSSWLRQMADGEIRTALPKTKKTSYNNWNSHRIKVIGCIAWLLNDARYKAYIDTALPQQIEKNLLPDGSGIDFHERDALHYHIYTLEPLISLATVLQRATGRDFYHYTTAGGASIKKSVDFLVPFATGEQTHGEFVNSKVAIDKQRADNKEPGYETGALFKPRTAIGVLTQAAYFEPARLKTAQSLSGKEGFPNWIAVLNAARRGS